MIEKIINFSQYLITNLLYKTRIINIENLVYRYDSKKIHVNLMGGMQGIIYKEITDDNIPVIKMDITNKNVVTEKGCEYRGNNNFYKKIVHKYPNYINGKYLEEKETYYINYYKVVGYIKNE